MADNASLIQGSKEWYAARSGKVTSSCFHKVMTKPRSGGGLSQTALTYMAELIGEKLSGRPAEEIKSKYLDWGNKYEPIARALYQLSGSETGHSLTQVGFIDHPTIDNCGGSPDMLVNNDGVGEIKCPFTSANHIKFCEIRELTPKISKEYFWQCQGNIWVTERDWLDFVSYHPLFPEDMQLHTFRVFRDQDAIDDLEEEIPRFLEQMEVKISKIKDSIRPDAWSK